jgi:hypothetical protein
MTMIEEESRELAFLFASWLQMKTPEEIEILITARYPNVVGSVPDVSLVSVAELEAGDVRTVTYSSAVRRWWQCTGGGCVAIPCLDMRPYNARSIAGEKLWPHPIISFYADMPSVLLIEQLGPAAITIWRYTLQRGPGGYSGAEPELCWSSAAH